MAPRKIIIDTDPGIDDILAMLLAFSARPEELEVLMLSITFGNVDAQSCLRNVVTLFQCIERERAWRKGQGRPEGFEGLKARKPIVAVGATEPLAEHMMVADFFHGVDGLAGLHTSHPALSPAETWKSLFLPTPETLTAEEAAEREKVKEQHALFTPSLKPAHAHMLDMLRENEPDTVSIVAIGPLTNLALAAASDAEAFLRVKEVIVMGGAVVAAGNARVSPTHTMRSHANPAQMTPGAEFNTYADSIAAARLFALTCPNPHLTMPPALAAPTHQPLPAYPRSLPRRLALKLFPLDITERHLLPRSYFAAYTARPEVAGSPLAAWATLFLDATFDRKRQLDPNKDPATMGLQLHDPLPVWYVLSHADARWTFAAEDLRVETSGQWTRGCIVADRRGRPVIEGTGNVEAEVAGDADGWRDSRRGNRVEWCTGSPGEDKLKEVLCQRIFGGRE